MTVSLRAPNVNSPGRETADRNRQKVGLVKNMLRLKAVILPVLLTLILGGAAAAQAKTTRQSPTVAADATGATGVVAAGLSNCDGGIQTQSLIAMNDRASFIGESGFFSALPGASRSFLVSSSQDQVVVTFSAEAGLTGSSSTNAYPNDYMLVEIRLDGVAMSPGNDVAFTSGLGQSSSMQTCQRVNPGIVHTVAVYYRLVDQGVNDNLGGVIDDWTLRVQVSD